MSPKFLRRRKTLVLNAGLAVLLIVAVAFAYTSIGTSSSSAATSVRTGTVKRGTVVTTVSASGTLVSPSDLGLGFVTGGTLRQVYVTTGQRVKVGQVLAKVDNTTQVEAVTTAKNGLAAANASLAELVQGQTPQQKAASAVQLEQSQAQITSAQNSLDFTVKSNAADAANLATAVATAQTNVTTAKTTLATDTATLATDKVSNTKNVTSDQSKVDQDNQSLTQATSALTQAQQQQSSGALKDSQSLSQAQQQVASAQLSYKGQLAQQAVTDAPPTASQLEQAKNSVTSAQIQLDSAERALDGTVLKSPSNGIVQSISTMVGGTVASGGSSSSSSSSTASTGGTGSTGTGSTGTGSTGTGSTGTGSTGTGSTGTGSTGTGSTNSATSTGGSTTTTSAFVTAADPTPAASVAGHTATVTSGDTGFIVLTGITGLQVQASFSEDDTASLSLGQGATMTLNALPDTPLNASVASIASTGTSSSGVVSYTVYLNLKTDLTTLKPGQSGSVSVITSEADNTLYVPSTAVTTAGGLSTVTVVNGSTKTRTPVTIGIVGDTTTAIKSGLTENETVALTTSTTGTSGFPTGGFPAGRGVTGTLGGTTGTLGGGGRG
jgi:multidrug efflux pump subunit AcrA (membrane-fusion protein)